MKLTILVVLFAVAGTWAGVARFDNYKVFRLTPTTDEQLDVLRQFEEIRGSEYDMWRGPTIKNNYVDIMVPPHKITEIYDLINRFQFSSKIIIENVQKLVDLSTPKQKARADGQMDWESYHRGDEINAWLDTLAERNPGIVTVISAGRSYEGRDLKGVRVSYREGNRGIFIEGGIHAREWISPATVTYILNELLTSENSSVRSVAEAYDWYIFPSVNPDGYEYTFSDYRLWRKTRQPHNDFCIGVDPNRNWNYHWMDGGASDYPCSETYAGPSAFSEPENQALADYAAGLGDHLVAYLAFHSYSQLLLLPYGHAGPDRYPENMQELEEIGQRAIDSLYNRHGTTYTMGNVVDILYIASGASMDYARGALNIPVSYTFELRDSGWHGFLLPPDQIIPTGEETLDAVVAIAQEMQARGY